MVYSGALEKLIHEKTRSRKSRGTFPLIFMFMWGVGGGAGRDARAVQHDRAPAPAPGRHSGTVRGRPQRGRLQQALLAQIQSQGDTQ
jgi:hypothetical protein